ncbi:MAG: anaerobic glycerol-3-phosphate dehydrogenase subunit C [Pirellulaceae bacterium]
MDQDRSRILADLDDVIDGDIYCDDLSLQMYATDASIHEIRPLAVISPATTRDVVQIVNYARDNQIPLHPRGSGSNSIGGCLGNGIVLDFSENMRRLVSVDREAVTVQPGAILANVNRELKSHGRYISQDPATRSITTIGGMLAMNLIGSHWLKSGSVRDKVLNLQVVLASGEVVNIDSSLNRSGVHKSTEILDQLKTRTRSLLSTRGNDLQANRPKTEVNQAGYHLWDLETNGEIDLTRLLIGSEGTLGIITKATLATDPLPRYRGVALLFFDRLETAAKAALEIIGMGVVACDMLDRRLLTLAREVNVRYEKVLPADAEAMLLVEFEGDDDAFVRGRLEYLANRMVRKRRMAFDVRTTTQKDERDLYWRLTRRVTPSLYRLRGNRRAIPFVEDIAVRPEKIPEFVGTVHQILNRHEITASIFSHVPQGVVQVQPMVDLSSIQQIDTLERVANELFETVFEHQGTISGMFGDGLSRTFWLRKQYRSAYSAFVEIKNVFDPSHLLNPGKIVDQPQRHLTDQVRKVTLAESLRAPATDDSSEEASVLPILQPQLAWNLDEMTLASRNCNGCGRCRTFGDDQRMCPIFRIGPRESASPRAKANLVRGLLTGQLSSEAMSKSEFKEIADLCVNCHQCRLECPAEVDIPKLMVEAKSQFVDVNGLRLNDWLLSRLDVLYAWAGKAPRLTNYLIQNRSVRWLLDRVMGIAQGRKLPRFSKNNFLSWAARQKLNRLPRQRGQKVVFFVDAYVNWNDSELGQAVVQVLQHNNVDVVVPQEQVVSGMSLISDGVLQRARKLAAKNVELLAEYVRQGFDVITTEPSAALALKHEYLNLINDADAELVAKNTYDACDYLWQMHQSNRLELDFRPMNIHVGYHQPCHQRALRIGMPGVSLLRVIPGVSVQIMDKGCSGMAGTWGLKRKNYLRSLRIGFPLINAIRNPDIVIGTTECATCRIQMEQGVSKTTAHPIKIMAYAYGLMPQLEGLMSRKSEELVIS